MIAATRLTIAAVAGAVGVLGLVDFASAAVGLTEGQPSVSDTGEAQYSIPIWAPPGTRGMTPRLAFSYGHRAGGMLMGHGWTVTGMSQISRCPKTWAQDGVARGVNLDVQDRFCLDGNQLKLVAGTYGSNGAEYRTELESYARIKSYGTAGTGPAYFIVEFKDGTIAEYGNSSDTRIESVGSATARSWLMNKHRDRLNNYIQYAYIEEATLGSVRISQISYTGNSAQSITPPYRIDFVYEPQPTGEVEAGYLANASLKDVTRLKRVDVSHINGGTTLLRRFEVDYEASLSSASRSRVSQIRECGGTAGTDCFLPTTFSYQNGTNNFSAKTDLALVPAGSLRPLVMDVNADGRTDVVYASNASTGVNTWRLRLSTGSGFASEVDTGVAANNSYAAIPIDYNSDGLIDLIFPYSGSTWWVMLASASGLGSPTNTNIPSVTWGGRALDVDGDGRDDLVYSTRTGIRYRLRDPNGTFGAQLTFVQGGTALFFLQSDPSANQYGRHPDFDDDGRADFVYAQVVGLNRTVYAYRVGANQSISLISNYESPVYYPDINQDGYTDVLIDNYGSQLTYRLSSGTGMTAWISGPALPGFAGLATADWDGDGFDDVLVSTGSGTWSVSRSSGEGLTALVSIGATAGSFQYGYTADFEGDGLDDLLFFDETAGTLSYNLHQGQRPDVLTTATDGFGNFVTFNYTTLAQGNYTKHTDAVFPNQDVQGSLSVVASLTTSDGIGGNFSSTYHYWGATINRQGRGFGGFWAQRNIDSRNGIQRYRYFYRAFPYTGMLLYEHPYTAASILISRDEFTATHLTWNAGTAEARYFPYISSSLHDSHEVGGAYNGAHLSRTTTTNLVDSTSGVVYDTTTTTTEQAAGNGVQAGQVWTARTWSSSLLSDVANWCLGKPSTIQQINSHTGYGGGSVTRVTGSSWDMVNCRPTQTQVQPGDANWQVTTVLGYDSFGNANSQSVTGIGMPTRTTTANWGSDGRRLLSSTNPLGHVTLQSWNPSGTVASITDPNGLVTSWLYDNFDRETRENRPDGTYTTVSFAACDASNGYCGVTWLRGTYYTNHYGSTGALVSAEQHYFDQFNRVTHQYRTGLDNVWTYQYRVHDAFGRVDYEVEPYQASSPTTPYRDYSYDLLGRRTQEFRWKSASDSTWLTTTAYYEGLSTRIVDPQSRTTKTIANAAGQVRRTLDPDSYYKQFDYDAFGNASRVQDSSGNTNQSASFNVRGLRLQSVDSDMGTWNYSYNALGELSSHTDAKGQTAYYYYDALSRPYQKNEPSPVSGTVTNEWIWGNSATSKNIGRIQEARVSGGGMTYYRELSYYDAVSRPSQVDYYDGSSWFSYNFGYNSAGQLEALDYPVSTSGYRHRVVNTYSGGQLKQVRDGDSGPFYWTANAADARGNVNDETMANGLRTTRSIDAATGLPSFIRTGPGGGQSIQNLNYTWDWVGNLKTRNDANLGLTEEFFYDNVYRLDYSNLNGSQNLNVDYNALGNITYKSDVGSYSYAGPRMHAVTNVAGIAYSYDGNGNISSRGSSTVTWYAHNRPYVINNGAYAATFEYGPNGNYWKQTATFSNGSETTRYIGGLMEIVQGPSVTSYRHHINANGRTVAIYSRGSNGANNTIYPLNDHLGSTDAVTNSSGTVIVKESFAAFGVRRNGNTWAGAPSGADMTVIGDSTRRGYTDHTMLDNIGLIHMNGRVVDPFVGRFVSPDPFVDGELDTQGWNRYAYVQNNPLSRTDPSGFVGLTMMRANVSLMTDDRASRHWLEPIHPMERCPRGTIDCMGKRGFGGGGNDDDRGLDEVVVSAQRDPGVRGGRIGADPDQLRTLELATRAQRDYGLAGPNQVDRQTYPCSPDCEEVVVTARRLGKKSSAANAGAIVAARDPRVLVGATAVAAIVFGAAKTSESLQLRFGQPEFDSREFIPAIGMEARLPLDVGGEEWGRRNGVGAAEGRRRAHGVKQSDRMSGATDRYTVDPDTGDVFDPEGEHIGNLNKGL